MTSKYDNIKTFSIIRRELTEELDHKTFGPMLDSFVSFASDKLGLQSKPTLKLEKDLDATSFGGYNPSDNTIVVVSKNRHPMDIFRTVAHELVHHKQNEDGRIKDVAREGSTGSDIENEANSEAGKIMRWFAKANPSMFGSSYVTEEVELVEGLQDPSRKKAIFLAGGPGSGKDFIMKRTIHGHGLTEINSDTALEYLMSKQGLSKKMPEGERAQREIVRGRAKNLRDEKQRLAISGRQGLIINGTADEPEKLVRAKEMFERKGYKTMMVYVNTNNEISRQRNIKRGRGGGREVPEDIRQEKWNAAQEAKERLREVFGADRFIHVDNNDDYNALHPEKKKVVDDHHLKIFKKVRKFVFTPHEDSEWEKTEMQTRGIKQEPSNRSNKISTRPNAEKQKYVPTASELEQAKRIGVQHVGNGQFGATKDKPTHISKNGQLVMSEDLRNWFDPKHPEGGWKRINSKGEVVGDCARDSESEAKPKCMSNEKRASLSKKERAAAVRAKRRHDPNPEREGLPINVSNYGKGKLTKEQTMEYLEEKNIPTNPNLWSRAKSLAKQKFDVYPSAYANGWAAKWYKSKGGGWKSGVDENFEHFLEENDPSKREWGTTSLADLYKNMTPGQSAEKQKKMIKRKRLAQEDSAPAMGYEFGNNGIGPTFGVVRSPTGYGTGYSLPMTSMAESIQTWANKETTINRFVAKYGNNAEQKLLETANVLNEAFNNDEVKTSKSFTKLREAWEAKAGRDMGTVLNSSSKEEIGEESPAWQRKEGKNPTGGLNRKGIESYRRENPGSKLSMAVTTKPSKLDPDSKAAKRRKSFCARMGGMPGPMKDEKGRPTRKALSLRKWNCEE